MTQYELCDKTDSAFRLSLKRLNRIVAQEYVLVVFTSPMEYNPPFGWMIKAYKSLSRRYITVETMTEGLPVITRFQQLQKEHQANDRCTSVLVVQVHYWIHEIHCQFQVCQQNCQRGQFGGTGAFHQHRRNDDSRRN